MSEVFIHPTAEVDVTASIGAGTKIWNQAQVRNNVVLGDHCILSKNVYVDEHVVIGNRVKVQNNVNIYHGVTIEDDVFLGPCMTFTNDMYPRSFSENWTIVKTLVKKGASIGANATIRCGVTIGEYAMVGSGTVVTKDIRAHALVIGNPSYQIGWVCKCGYRLNEDGECRICGCRYNTKEWEKDNEEISGC